MEISVRKFKKLLKFANSNASTQVKLLMACPKVILFVRFIYFFKAMESLSLRMETFMKESSKMGLSMVRIAVIKQEEENLNLRMETSTKESSETTQS